MNSTRSDSTLVVQFQDACAGPYCNAKCPETIVLGEVHPYWSTLYQVVVLVVVVGVTLVGVVMKVVLSLRDIVTSLNQKHYLKVFLNRCFIFQSPEASVSFFGYKTVKSLIKDTLKEDKLPNKGQTKSNPSIYTLYLRKRTTFRPRQNAGS